ncbi:MAG: hypothetical protein Kow0090_18060 [Myxococcota bacterium]
MPGPARKAKELLETARLFFKAHGYHLFFALVLVSLAALIGWWSVFIRAAIEIEREQKYENLDSIGRVTAITLGHQKVPQPATGVYRKDERFEIGECKLKDSRFSYNLRPYWTELCIAPRDDTIAEIEAKFKRRKLMIVGESSLLIFLILLSVFMLYRLIRVERRFAIELNEFFSRITHEIKTPITGVKAFLQTLRGGKIGAKELSSSVDMALRLVERQERLAENILIARRLEKNGFGLKLRDVELSGYIENFVEGHRSFLGEDRVTIASEIPKDTLVIADTDALHAIFDNIVNNAVKYCGESLRLTIEITQDDASAFVAFKDNGPGFEPKDGVAIFQPYRRLSREASKNHSGTGMGLYISRRLALKMGGELRGESEGEGKGASFILTLKKS